jgi:hypothetical protein
MQGSSFKAAVDIILSKSIVKRKSVYVNYKEEVSKQSTIVTFIKKNKWLKISQIRCKLD